MRYLDQPRGPGTAYRFKMKTPKHLHGKVPPWSEKPLGTWIIRGLNGERHLPSAKKLRDTVLGEVRAFEARVLKQHEFSLEMAEAWNEALRTEDDQPFIMGLIRERTERAPIAQREAFRRVAVEGTLSLAMAHERYVEARRSGNGFGYRPFGQTTLNDLRTAVRHLALFYEIDATQLVLTEVTKKDAIEFRGTFLPSRKSKRTGEGLSLATVEKQVTLLRGLWAWAIENEKVPTMVNPFDTMKGVPRQRKSRHEKTIDLYTPPEVTALFEAAPQGDRMGDLIRLALVTGARQSELVKIHVCDVREGSRVISIPGGKTENARRVLPIPELAQPLVRRLCENARVTKAERLFESFPLKHSSGNASATSKAFTILRRKVLGTETDGRLNFHSFRHTWKTNARRAGIAIDDTNDLGGWSGERRSSDPYDHGLLPEALAEAQESIASYLSREGYLDAF